MSRKPILDEAYQRLPFPIAFHVGRCLSRRAQLSPESRFTALAAALEGLVRYLGLLIVSDYLQQGAFDPKFNDLLQANLRRPPTLGGWVSLLREGARAFIARRKEPRLPGLLGLLSRREDALDLSPFLRQLEDLVAWRNRITHPEGTPDLAGAIDQRYDQFNGLLGALDFLANHELIVPARLARGNPRLIEEKVVCMGDRQGFTVRDCSVEVPESLGTEVLPEVSPLLLDAEGRRVLTALYPLYLFDIYPQEDELYNYLQSLWRADRPYSLTFGPHQPSAPPLQIRRGEDPGREHVLEAFERRVATALAGRAASAPAAGLRSFAMPAVEGEVAYHLERFVGRGQDADRLDRWLKGRERGYVFYEAAAGAGKSAYASYLMSRFSWPGHLIKKDNQRDQPARFLQYLVWQLMERHGVQDQIPAEAGALAEALFNVLDRAGRRLQRTDTGREVVVVDGLDELDPAADDSFFPDLPPPRVFIVVLAQPCARLEALVQRVKGERMHGRLEGLSDEEAHRLLDLAEVLPDEEERRQVIERAGGWPLYLRHVIDAIRSGESWQDVPARLEQFYRHAVERACQACGAEVVVHVLGLLWAAREPIGVQALAGMCGLSGLEMRAVLQPLQPYLLPINRRFTLYHRTFHDYVGDELLTADQRRRFAEEIVRWSART